MLTRNGEESSFQGWRVGLSTVASLADSRSVSPGEGGGPPQSIRVGIQSFAEGSQDHGR